MAITQEQAINAREFHDGCRCVVGPKGGIKLTSSVWRRNGQTKLWKTRPDDFQVPVKFGLRDYAYLGPHNAHLVYADGECPVCSAVSDYYQHRDIERLRAELASTN